MSHIAMPAEEPSTASKPEIHHTIDAVARQPVLLSVLFYDALSIARPAPDSAGTRVGRRQFPPARVSVGAARLRFFVTSLRLAHSLVNLERAWTTKRRRLLGIRQEERKQSDTAGGVGACERLKDHRIAAVEVTHFKHQGIQVPH